MKLEQSAEITRAGIPDLSGDLPNLLRRIGQQFYGLGHSQSGQVLHEGCSGYAMETLTKVVRRNSQAVGNLNNTDIVHVVLVCKIYDLVDEGSRFTIGRVFEKLSALLS